MTSLQQTQIHSPGWSHTEHPRQLLSLDQTGFIWTMLQTKAEGESARGKANAYGGNWVLESRNTHHRFKTCLQLIRERWSCRISWCSVHKTYTHTCALLTSFLLGNEMKFLHAVDDLSKRNCCRCGETSGSRAPENQRETSLKCKTVSSAFRCPYRHTPHRQTHTLSLHSFLSHYVFLNNDSVIEVLIVTLHLSLWSIK